MTLHSDTVFTSHKTILILLKLLKSNGLFAGTLKQNNLSSDIKIIHILGCLWNFDYLMKNKELLLPEFPKYDCGEKIFKNLQQYIHGSHLSYKSKDYNFYNSLNLQFKNPFRYNDGVDIFTSNDNEDILFLHLGRGVEKSKNNYSIKNKMNINDWNNIVVKLFL